MRVQRAIGEDVASADFQIICPHAGAAFVAESMEDVDDGGRKKGSKQAKGDAVVCTTELGLRRCEKGEGGAGIRVATLLKAKVVLPVIQGRESTA